MMKCDPRAYAQCPTHQYCGTCAADADFMEGSECDKFNQAVLSKPMTNADRIRAMSDEEMVDFYHSFNICDIRGNDECKFMFLADCRSCVLEWLKQPAEGE